MAAVTSIQPVCAELTELCPPLGSGPAVHLLPRVCSAGKEDKATRASWGQLGIAAVPHTVSYTLLEER